MYNISAPPTCELIDWKNCLLLPESHPVSPTSSSSARWDILPSVPSVDISTPVTSVLIVCIAAEAHESLQPHVLSGHRVWEQREFLALHLICNVDAPMPSRNPSVSVETFLETKLIFLDFLCSCSFPSVTDGHTYTFTTATMREVECSAA